MTEESWLRERYPERLLPWYATRTARKKLLLCCACCWRANRYSNDPRVGNALFVAERHADGLATESERRAAKVALKAFEAEPKDRPVESSFLVASASALLAANLKSVNQSLEKSRWVVGWAAGGNGKAEAEVQERKVQGELVRHIFGNPFRPYAAPEEWPAHVIQLADAVYNGADCGFALYDALLEAGHPELAEHFRQEQAHPKGCWVVDLVLNKK